MQASTVGAAPWSGAADVNTSAAAIYTPLNRGFPADGVLAIGELDRTQWVFTDIEPAAVARVRSDGQVLNHRDWAGQLRGGEVH